ncbi:terminase large subunit [Altericroceibacterium spongiae]|uniref:Terminase large subunit n=1 Tax=Altericroceibacterium spongiae TaxID=2320269 RepID=A0A420ERQ8_9SPHN|nr:terminase TerL endonuclease subunit [Altericroceibacterium spongiae]RKF23367.1 terminase large subunit [Altericroceibacterium spongiae]
MAAKRPTPSSATETGHARDYAAIALDYARKAAKDKKQRRHCKYTRLAAQRHLDDLKRSRKKEFRYKFSAWHANDVCDFIEKLPHIEGVWDTPTITLEPAQIFVLAVVFGWRRKENGLRRFTVVYEEVARKNAKSTKTAGVSLYCLCCEDEVGPQVLTVATTFDQAKKVFHPAKRMVEKTPDLQEAFLITPWAKSITCDENGGYMQPLHAKSKSQDGHNPHLVTLDEFHAHKDRSLYDVMRSAFGARKQPLMWAITTAGPNIHGPCYEERTFATKVLEGSVEAEHYFACIWTLDRAEDYDDGRKVGDDPFDPDLWCKANPLLGASVQLEELRQYALEAKENPAAENEFKTKRLNIWSGAASAWLSVAKWQACGDETLSIEDFRGLDCWIGADLSNVDDLSALVLAALDADGRLLVKTWFFLPEARLGSTDSKVKQVTELYKRWVEDGALIKTEGDFIDHRVIEDTIRWLKEELSVHGTTFDQWNSGLAMAARLNEDFDDGGEPFAVQMAKKAANTTDPAKAIEARVKSGPGRLRHDANPVMTWMVGNTFVDRRVDGSLLPKKELPNSANKIDGVDAMINATAPMLVPEEEGGGVDSFIQAMRAAA